MKPLDLDDIRERVKQIGHAGAFDTQDLLALVDLQTRALLAVEWTPTCPGCDTNAVKHAPQRAHLSACPLDAALTAAGLDTPEKRDAAREAMRGGG